MPDVWVVQLNPALTGKLGAPAQSSLAGGGGGVPTQMLNVVVAAPEKYEYTRT